RVEIKSNEVLGTVEVRVAGLEKVVRLPAGELELTPAQLQESKSDIDAYLLECLKVQINGKEVEAEPGALEPVHAATGATALPVPVGRRGEARSALVHALFHRHQEPPGSGHRLVGWSAENLHQVRPVRARPDRGAAQPDDPKHCRRVHPLGDAPHLRWVRSHRVPHGLAPGRAASARYGASRALVPGG